MSGHSPHNFTPCYWRSMYEDQLRRKRLLHERYDRLHKEHTRVAEALDEALSEQERDSSTDVWLSFWDRLLDGDEPPIRGHSDA